MVELSHIPADLQDELKDLVQAIKTGDVVKEKETVRLRKDGTAVDVSLSAFPIAEQNNKGWAFVMQDITEWKEAQEIFQNTEKLNLAGQLAAGIAHEIRNPITAIKGFIQLMGSGASDVSRYYEIIKSEISRIELILSELLMLAKPQVHDFEQKDMKSILSHVVTLLNTQAIMKNIQIETELEAEITELRCDENQLKQVFINYLKNAIEAMPDGGCIRVQLQNPDPAHILVRIIDQGFGMSEELLARLGQPFYTTKEKGTGLGFMISKRIIESHNGEVNVYSKENKGTTIEVLLPCRPPR